MGIREVVDKSELSPVLNVANKYESESASKTNNDDEKSIEDEQFLSTEEIDAMSQLVSPDPVQSEREILQRIKAAMLEENRHDQEKKLGNSNVTQVGTKTLPFNKERVNETLKPTSASKNPDEINPVVKTLHNNVPLPFLKSGQSKEKLISDKSTNLLDLTKDPTVGTKQNNLVYLDVERKIDGNEELFVDDKLNKTVQRLKSKVESMVGKIEIQLSTVEAKIGDKLHYLDKDMDGILSREEMALCLQSVLKRSLSFEEAMTVTADMDENEDGLFSIEELLKWLETSKRVKLVKEGRDGDVHKIFSAKPDPIKAKKE